MRKFSPATTGAFVLGAMLLLAAAVTIVGGRGVFKEHTRYVVYFEDSVHGLTVGAPVEFRGIRIGSVAEMRIDLRHRPDRPEQVRIPVVLSVNEDRLTVSGGTGGPNTLATLVDDGLRAELAVDSIVTGLRYIDLSMRPDIPPKLVNDPTMEYPEIPVAPAVSQQLQRQATKILSRLSEVDYVALVESVRSLVDSLQEIVSSPELATTLKEAHTLVRNLNAAVTELRRVARSLGPDGTIGEPLAEAIAKSAGAAQSLERLLHPEGGFSIQLEDTLTEVDEAARSLRTLAEQISRDPGSLIRGGPP